jgi:hypothetical protein
MRKLSVRQLRSWMMLQKAKYLLGKILWDSLQLFYLMGSRELKREKEYAAGMLKLLGSVARRVSESAGMSVLIMK